jgi:hypothetical protein
MRIIFIFLIISFTSHLAFSQTPSKQELKEGTGKQLSGIQIGGH